MSNEVAIRHSSGTAMMLDKDTFEQAYRAARLFASSKLVPQHFQGKEADCFIGLMVAQRMGEDPLTVLQNMYVVHGRPGWSTQYMIARANAAGVFKGRISWKSEGKGDDLAVTATAVLADTGEQVEAHASMAMARAEEWTRNSKYKTMPEHMLRWRSAAMLIRLYAPEVMLGYQTAEELETTPLLKDVTPAENPILSNIAAQIEAEKVAVPEPEDVSQAPVVPTFDIAAQNLKTQAGIREAVKQLCALLEATSEEERGYVFLSSDGMEIVSAANRAGLAMQVQKFTDLGVNIPNG